MLKRISAIGVVVLFVVFSGTVQAQGHTGMRQNKQLEVGMVVLQ